MSVYISEYRVLSYLGSGSGHQVMKVYHNQTSQILAMKIEKSPNLGQIEAEVQKLKHLKGIIGIPQLLDYGKTKDFCGYLITPILKSNLQDILRDSSMTISQILAIGLGILEILEQVHKQNVLHLDIKPENIMLKEFHINFPIEHILKPGFIQLIDFGLSQRAGSKISQNKYFVGSLRYASRQAHKGNQLHFKDDLESLLYMLVYLRNKKLPWQCNQQYRSQQLEIRKIGEIKEAVFNTLVLTQKFPQLFMKFKQYIDELTYMEMPDYNYLKLLFRQMLKLENFSNSFQNKFSFSQSNSFNENNQIQNAEMMILSFRNLYKNDSQKCEEDLFDTETSFVQISDWVKTYNTQTTKSIIDIKFDSKCS
ncbi:unnamed protein product [Paramecium sonneborni]|uniref:Casein kinase I n=1 Tax=Paramecium sonneborni TaxID=65129 RepID=A0A8S1NMS5_9CILI|nr:unnamed protein product [Paramecium sonneborni]